MKRNIISINEEKCNGCGICVTACHEGALQMVDGKAKLISDAYCDGLGACLPECPTGAITIEEREADAFDEVLVNKLMAEKQQSAHSEVQAQAHGHAGFHGGCPGSRAFALKQQAPKSAPAQNVPQASKPESQLRQWPVQIKLVPPNAPYFDNAHLLVAADCTAFAYANIHSDFMKNKITIIGCPKLDEGDYADKLAAILSYNDIKSVTVLRMEVPCCGGIVNAAKKAMINSGKMIPWQVVTISTDGEVLEQ